MTSLTAPLQSQPLPWRGHPKSSVQAQSFNSPHSIRTLVRSVSAPAIPFKTVNISKESVKDVYNSSAAQQRNEAYNKLTSAARQCGEEVAVPEIVVVGGQSDGKSSLLEAFLGFRFNLREVEMGTRRPLVVQMNHSEAHTDPECCFQEESGPMKGQFGAPVETDLIADDIRKRTAAILEAKGGQAAVADTPLVMRVRYAYCPNLTLWDTPGLILKAKDGDAGDTPEEIGSMVRELLAPPHRLIVFLQQSNVEWSSSLWLPIIQEVSRHVRHLFLD